ncbi:MliC family protein [Aeromonas veronii]|uniref:MliC family protein n=1 Tax=Aeromonas veronii TaxID=654 RepID=UPI002444F2C5|nr:MliC family protein [Aeromonas veronii]
MKKLIALLPLLGLAACSSPQPTQYQYSQYQCGEEMLAVTYDAQADMVQFPYAGVYHKLARVESESGAKYSDSITTFWNQDKQALLTQKGVTLLTCTLK